MTTCVGLTSENQPSHHLGLLGFLRMIKHASKGRGGCLAYGIIQKRRGCLMCKPEFIQKPS